MDGFKNLEINNFRGIEHLTIDDFARVNVFLGQNSSGKSSVLESIIMLMGMSNPDLPQLINTIRGRNYSSFSDLSYLFRNGDLKTKPEIAAKLMDDTRRYLSLEMAYKFDEKSQGDFQNGHIPTSETKTFLNTLRMLFEVEYNSETKRYECGITVGQNGMTTGKKMADNYMEKNSVAFIPADLASGNPVNDLVELIKRKRKEYVLEMMQKFDSRITAVEILNNAAYIGLEGIDQLMAVNMMGDGMRRYLNIVAASANPTNNILLIDEIDNGLHYSAYKKLWEAIFALATDTNKQVFVTTHSKETLYRLNEMIGEHSEYQDALRLYTIEKTKLEGHQAYKYSFEGLNAACKNDVEIRSLAL